MPITKLTPENNYPYLEDRLRTLGQVVPEAFADGKINWDTLRESLGDNMEDEGRDEYFGLNWPGKRAARKRAATPSRATLVPAPGEGVNEDTTENLFIEGDNLEVLKLLQKSYAGKFKMIYIDPPYNTENDFIYNDNFTDPLEAYLDYTGARGESGELLTTNTRADGRFHSKWLNMIYPRLILAHQLLREDAVIFVSIDDNEVHHLRQMLNEVFGEENFIGNFIWQSRTSISNDRPISLNHNHTLVYAKDFINLKFYGLPLDHAEYKNPDNDPRGPWKPIPLDANKPGGNTLYPIKNPNTGEEYYPPNGRSWAINPEEYKKLLEDGRIVFGVTGEAAPKKKLFLKEREEKGDTKTPSSLSLDYGTTQNGTDEIMGLFNGKKVFSYPKPTKLIQALIQFGGDAEALIMDFYSGSSTTAHSIFLQNKLDSGKRKFFLIQLPEKVDLSKEEGRNAQSLGLNTIADIGKERIRRVIAKIENDNTQVNTQIPLLQNSIDLGFKVFKYTRSNFKQWKPLENENVVALTPLFDNISDPLIPGWKKEDLLTEVLLLEGFPLTSQITYFEELHKNQVYRVTAPDFCAHDLFVCLDETVHPSTIELLTMEKEDIFVCLDSALSDELKARVQDKFNVHVI